MYAPETFEGELAGGVSCGLDEVKRRVLEGVFGGGAGVEKDLGDGGFYGKNSGDGDVERLVEPEEEGSGGAGD